MRHLVQYLPPPSRTASSACAREAGEAVDFARRGRRSRGSHNGGVLLHTFPTPHGLFLSNS